MAQEAWSWLVVIYLFLGGLGAGAFLTAAFFEMRGWRAKGRFCPTCLTGAMISGPAVAIGSLLLILDLGAGKSQPWRIIYLFTNFQSVMTWGIWILLFFIPIALLYGFMELVEVSPYLRGFLTAQLPGFLPRLRSFRPWVLRLGCVLALATAIYTGVLISALGPAIPLWSQPLLPLQSIPVIPFLFLVSAISTGLALTFDLVGSLSRPEIHNEIQAMPLIHIIIVVLENVLIGLLLISALSSGGEAAKSAQMIISGPLSVIFWIGIVLLGLVFPGLVYLYTLSAKRHSMALSLTSGAAVILAGLLLRYVVVAAGIPITL